MSRVVLSRVLALVVLLAPAVSRADVVINEIMYNTDGTPDIEYVELYNTGPSAVSLDGWYLLDDGNAHDRCMLVGTLAPGEYLAIAGLLDTFQAAYPGITNVNPNPFDSDQAGVGFGLGNTTDQVRVFDDSDDLVDQVEYTDVSPWPLNADGGGSSLELLNPVLNNADPSNWGASINGPAPGGTPGFQNSIFQNDLPPQIDSTTRSPVLPQSADTVLVTTRVVDDQALTSVELLVDLGAGYVASTLFDDGAHGDGGPGDDVYGASIPPGSSGSTVRYYVRAVDDSAQQTTEPASAPATYHAYTVDHVPPRVLLSEMLAANQNGIQDEEGDRDDWVELFNPGPMPVELGGMFLTDDPTDPQRWMLPAQQLAPGERLVIWCDAEPIEGPLHANFRLTRAGGSIGLYDTIDHGQTLVHGYRFGPQTSDIAFGFRPEDSDAPEYLVPATPGLDNTIAQVFSSVCINEFLAASQIGVPDWIELFNRGTSTINIGGWHLSDDATQTQKYVIPSGTLIAPGQFLSVDQATLGFGLASDGSEAIVLTASDGETGRDYYDYGPQFDDVSEGRLPDGRADWQRFSPTSRDLPNQCNPAIPPLAPVAGLRFASASELIWDALPAADRYDVVEGDLALLRATGDFAIAVMACSENNSPDPTTWVPTTPPQSSPRFYLVRGLNGSCAFGTYDTAAASQSAPRDPGIEAAIAACP